MDIIQTHNQLSENNQKLEIIQLIEKSWASIISPCISPYFFSKNNLIQLYNLVHLHIRTCHQSDYILRHRAYRGNIYYCRKLDTAARISRGWLQTKNTMGAYEENTPLHTWLVIKQVVSLSKRLIHWCVIPCLNNKISKPGILSLEF